MHTWDSGYDRLEHWNQPLVVVIVEIVNQHMAYYTSRPDSLLDVFQLRYFPYTLRRTKSCTPSTHKKNDILNKIYENEK